MKFGADGQQPSDIFAVALDDCVRESGKISGVGEVRIGSLFEQQFGDAAAVVQETFEGFFGWRGRPVDLAQFADVLADGDDERGVAFDDLLKGDTLPGSAVEVAAA